MNAMNNAEFERTMARLAAEHKAARAPVDVEYAVLAEFDAMRHRRRNRAIAAFGAIAATLVVGTILIREPRPAPRPAVVVPTVAAIPVTAKPAAIPRPVKRKVARRRSIVEAPFVTIPYTVPLAPGENATVVRMTLSPSAMAVAGFPLQAIDPGGTEADVLVSEDGRARAIRIVASSNFR